MEIKERIEQLRQIMKKNKMDAYIVPSFDSHHSEYVANHFKSRQWISGFTGSAGTAVVTLNDAGLWTDGRYYIQAEKQVEGSGMRLFRMSDQGVPSFTKWLSDTLEENTVVGFDGSVFTVNQVREMLKSFKPKNISIKIEDDLIDSLWKDRPQMPGDPIYTFDVKYAGKSRTEKLNEVREYMKKKNAEYHLLTSLDDIAWLLNIRGNDVLFNPVAMSYVIVSPDKCFLFIDPKKVPDNVKTELESDGIELKKYDDVHKFLTKLPKKSSIMFDPNVTNSLLYNEITEGTLVVECANITTSLKGIKNKTEIENLKNAELKDGVTMVKFLKWLKTSVGTEEITEYSAGQKLDKLRMENPLCVGPSFGTIAGYKDHAAMMHYTATPDVTYKLKKEGMLLVDSGGQYYNGTTDITRTIVLGKLTQEEKRDYTLVLKSHIALATTVFLYGLSGSCVDIMAREPIWKYGMDYKCGTGHGVGFFLNVHEGPHTIRPITNSVPLEEGMDVTNEPGIYTEGKHGIRTENMMLVVKGDKTEYGQFMKFETITYCPIDTAGVNKAMLTPGEINWLNNYNHEVFTKLSPFLTKEEKDWLRKETKRI